MRLHHYMLAALAMGENHHPWVHVMSLIIGLTMSLAIAERFD